MYERCVRLHLWNSIVTHFGISYSDTTHTSTSRSSTRYAAMAMSGRGARGSWLCGKSSPKFSCGGPKRARRKILSCPHSPLRSNSFNCRQRWIAIVCLRGKESFGFENLCVIKINFSRVDGIGWTVLSLYEPSLCIPNVCVFFRWSWKRLPFDDRNRNRRRFCQFVVSVVSV